MPELPEVETTRLGLVSALEGLRIASASVRHPRLARRQANPADFSSRLKGRRVRSLDRIGKFLMFDIEGDFTWVTPPWHVRTNVKCRSCRIGVASPHPPCGGAEQKRGREVRMIDPRTFGFTSRVHTLRSWPIRVVGSLGRDAWTDLPAHLEIL